MVRDADVVLVLLSSDSVKSSAVRYEVSCALARESEERRTILFVAMIEPCKPMPEWDSTRLYANLHTSFARQFPKLKRSLLIAAGKALPRATAIPDSQALVQMLRTLLLQWVSMCAEMSRWTPGSGTILLTNLFVLRRSILMGRSTSPSSSQPALRGPVSSMCLSR